MNSIQASMCGGIFGSMIFYIGPLKEFKNRRTNPINIFIGQIGKYGQGYNGVGDRFRNWE